MKALEVEEVCHAKAELSMLRALTLTHFFSMLVGGSKSHFPAEPNLFKLSRAWGPRNLALRQERFAAQVQQETTCSFQKPEVPSQLTQMPRGT